MISLNVHVGSNPLLQHKPQSLILCSPTITIGQSGQLFAWDEQNKPLYQMVASINGDAGRLIAAVDSPLRILSQQEVSRKLITIHEDNRLRIWELRDGTCINISTRNIFNGKVTGLAKCMYQTRFVFAFGQQTIYVVDSWLMKVIGTISPQVQFYVNFVKGVINADKQLELMDTKNKTYIIDIEILFSEKFIDVGSYVSNNEKAIVELQKAVQSLANPKAPQKYRKLEEQSNTQRLQQIQSYITTLRQNKNHIFDQLFEWDFLPRKQQVRQFLKDQQPTVSSMHFIKGSRLWYFIGMKSGKICGFPTVVSKQRQWAIISETPCQYPVKYIHLTDNLLLVSWENGFFRIYTVDNHQYLIEQQKKRIKEVDIEKSPLIIGLGASVIFDKKLPLYIKYSLRIHTIYNSSAVRVSSIMAYQLHNNEVIIVDQMHKQIQHFCGVPEDQKVFCVLFIEDYIGIAHTTGIDMYSPDKFERTILYSQWYWNDYNLFDKINWPEDYHCLCNKNIIGTDIIEFANRYFYKKVDYYSTQNTLSYETFGLVDDGKIENDAYPLFHFVQKIHSQNSVHSRSSTHSTAVLKLKHDNVRRDYWDNTSFILHGNLIRQLQNFQQEPENLISKDFLFYTLFCWEQMRINYLKSILTDNGKIFVLKKRFTQQGIGKTFTLYFQNDKRLILSSETLSFQAIATTSFFQASANKYLQLSDQMVSAVEHFSSGFGEGVSLNADVLAKCALSENQNIMKASINLLMSTVLTKGVNMHPIYDYFILNMKNIQESKNRMLSATQCHWIVLMGICVVYGNQKVETQQVKTLVNRIMQSIEQLIKQFSLLNFQLRPDLVAVVMKILNEGIAKWKPLLTGQQIVQFLTDLFRVFFYYDGLSVVSADDKKFNYCFQKIPQSQVKKMKQSIIRTIVYISKEFNSEFLQVLRNQALSQKVHLAYPSSVIQILRQYIKSEKPVGHLVFFIELLLQCLSPMTPQLRKYVQKNVLLTLQLMCSYKTISFNQPSQKLSLLTQSHIYIYCLRTSTKWRTINIKNESKESEKQEMVNPTKNTLKKNMVLEMSPKGTYIALLSTKLQVWRLSSGFWSGVLGAFSQGWTFDATGNALQWEENEQSITVIHPNPSNNQNYKL